MRVFISWSGKLSNEVAKQIKTWLYDSVFSEEQHNLDIFMSEEDIGVGADWLSIIKSELEKADCAVVIVTRENISAPWLNFEAGSIAVSHSEKRVIPLLIDVDVSDIRSPLKHFQSTKIEKSAVKKLISDLKNFGDFSSPSHLEDSIERLFGEIEKMVSSALAKVADVYSYEDITPYPEHVKGVKKGKVFIGVPMASVEDDEYEVIKNSAIKIKNALLKNTGCKEVYCPCEEIENRGKFEGYKKAIRKDFKILKESEHYIFVYPRKITSSILVEIGYAIALNKNTTIFTKNKDDLPYMLRQANTAIPNIEIYSYKSVDDIVDVIRREGSDFLVRANDT